MYLLDTNVISELRITGADKQVKAWAGSVAANSLYLSAMTVLELEMGILLVERRDAKQGMLLRCWLEERVMPAFDGRILAIDSAVARCCAALHVPDPRSERDALIAATALVHGMVMVTRNIADFAPTSVTLLNPWD